MKKLAILIVCLWALLNCKQYAMTQVLPDETKTRINALFAEFDNLNSPGYAIGISKGETPLYMKGYGSANLDYNLPISPNSAFSIASVSKQFTAACVALLILEEKLSLESDAAEFIPELKKYSETIQVKHLIYNTSGLTDYHRLKRKNGTSWITFNYFDIDECIATSLAEEKLQFKPGEKWDYCNVNFMLLAKIVETVSGQSFPEFAKQRLFEPLAMSNSLIHTDITQVIKNRVTPYNHRTEDNVNGYQEYGVTISQAGKYIQHPRTSPHYGGSGVVTTIEDILKWSINMMNHDFGGQEFYDLMHTTLKFQHDRDNQAFGLHFGDFNGRKIVSWDGGDWGISSQLMRFPDQGIAIVVLSNLGSGRAYQKVNEIANVLIDAGIIE